MTDLNFKGLSEADAHVLLYVAELLEHGFQPRIINVTPDIVAQEWERIEGGDPLTEDDLWKIAKQADEEIENDHHWLDGVSEDMTDTVVAFLEDRADV